MEESNVVLNNRMKNELYKVKREIQTHGSSYFIQREQLDNYRESTGKFDTVLEVKALFHTTKSYITDETSEGTKYHTKGSPLLMMEYSSSDKINNGDIVYINDNKYVVVEKNNILNMNIVSDISLEVVLNGNN
jgi:hypothetical protein